MVADPGAPSRPAELRPLNLPRPIAVTVRDRRPAAVTIGKVTQAITRVQDTWVLDEEWWRAPIRRQYFRVVLESGHQKTIFHDRTNGSWWEQEY